MDPKAKTPVNVTPRMGARAGGELWLWGAAALTVGAAYWLRAPAGFVAVGLALGLVVLAVLLLVQLITV